jgi:SET family sugar efflux transporter-like MFS transporter
MSTTVFASTLGGLIGTIGITPLGLPHVYFVPAVICAFSFVGLFFLSAWQSRRERKGLSPTIEPS